MEINKKRWKEAQKEERIETVEGLRTAREISKERYEEYLKFMNKYFSIKSSNRILDIGCKTYGMINFIKKGERYGLDPLIGSIKLREPQSEGPHVFDNATRKEVGYIVAIGEYLPFQSKTFDIVITTNALDHTYKPMKILNEIYRVLNQNGWLVLSVYNFGIVNKVYRTIREKIGRGDVYHPFSFTCKEVERMLAVSGFKVIGSKSFKIFAPTIRAVHKRVLINIYEMTLTKIDKILDKRVQHTSVDTLFLCKKSEPQTNLYLSARKVIVNENY